MLRGYKYRIYPTKEQINYINQNVGSNRWFYNYALNKIEKHYKETNEHLSCQYQIAKDLPLLKKNEETKWLADVCSTSLIWTAQFLDSGYKKYFKACKNRKNGIKDDSGKPSIKKKQPNGSYTISTKGLKVLWNKNQVILPKLKEPVKASLHRKFNGKIKNATISFNKAKQYFVSFTVEDGIDKVPLKKVEKETTIGIDLGVKNSIITSDGVKYESIKTSLKDDKKYRRLCRILSKKEKYSKNYNKAQLKLAKFENRLVNRRKAFINKVAHDITSDGKVTAIAMEDLNVKGMLSNHKTAKSIQEASFNAIKTAVEYKASCNGVNFVEVDRFYPSTKTCNKCGYKNNDLTLKDRKWVCPICGEHHDRDINAAMNIKDEGVKILTEA